MFNVLYVDYKPILAGGQMALLSLLKEVNQKQVNTTVVVPSTSPFTEALQRYGIHFEVIPLGTVQKSSNPVIVLKNLLDRVVPTIRLARLIRRKGIDIVHANGTFSFISSCFAAKLCRVPVIWWVHNTGLSRNGVFLIPFIRLADRIVVVTEAIRQEFTDLVKEAEGKTTTIYNGLDLRRFEGLAQPHDKRQELGIPDSALVIGTVSRLAPEKGLSDFIDAAPQALSAMPRAWFLVVGDGPMRGKLEAEAIQKGLGGRMIFTGFRRDVLDLLAAMDIFALSAISREALSIAVLEAMALKKPVVATNVGGTYELVVDGENGLLVPPGDAKGLAEALIALCKDKGKRMVMGKAGRRRVERLFRIEDMVAKNLELYRELVDADRRQPVAL